MEDTQGKSLVDLITKLNEIEANRLVLTISIYNRKVQDAKKRKLEYISNYFKSKIYDVSDKKKESLELELQNILDQYSESLDKIISIYTAQQVKLQSHLQNSEIAQKFVINEIIKSYGEYKKNEKSIDIEKYKTKLLKNVQDKLNYDVIIEECEARIELCTESALEALDMLIQENPNNNIAVIPKENFISRFLKILRIFKGSNESKNNKVIEEFKNDLESLKIELESKVQSVKYEIIGFDIQMDNVKKQF